MMFWGCPQYHSAIDFFCCETAIPSRSSTSHGSAILYLAHSISQCDRRNMFCKMKKLVHNCDGFRYTSRCQLNLLNNLETTAEIIKRLHTEAEITQIYADRGG